MSASQSRRTSAARAQAMLNAIWPYIGGRRGLFFLAAGIAITGMALNWGWLVAAGIAPILLAILPCAAMCALGLCMKKTSGTSCSSGNKTPADGSTAGGDSDEVT